MKPQPFSTAIFDPEILDSEITNFSLESIPGIHDKRKIVACWIDELVSGRIAQSKEEEIKPRFLNEIFGDVLGYAFRGSNSWNARFEFKTFVDTTKADAALGTFVLSETGIINDVIAIVEIKDFYSDLDKSKNNNNQTPLEQAFGYAHKTNARWVVVSNFQEIRLYKASYSGECETFLLKNLNDDDLFKRFIMLFHRQSLMDGTKSRVDKLYELQRSLAPGFFSANQLNPADHIVDQMWKSLRRFDGMDSIDPFIIANIAPFNILSEYVWHYDHFRLFTLNPKIYHLLVGLKVDEEGTNLLTDDLRKELEGHHVVDFEEKLDYILNRLRASLIHTISALNNYDSIEKRHSKTIGFSIRMTFHFSEENNEGITRSIYTSEAKKCECVNCLFRTFDLKELLKRLKQKGHPSLENAYGNYLVATNGYKRAFELYSDVIKNNEGNTGKRVETFIAHYNQQLLFNLISWYNDPDKGAMLNRIKAIDLDELLYTSFRSADRDVREALKELRDDRVVLRAKKKIDESLENLKQIKVTYDNGDAYHSVGNYTGELHFALCQYYVFVHRNYLALDAFTNYQEVIKKVLEGLLISHSLQKYPYRLSKFQLLHLMESTISVPSQKLEELLQPWEEIEMEEKDLILYLERVKDFLNSHFEIGVFDQVSVNTLMQEHLLVSHFKEKCSRIFSNMFLFLTRIKIEPELWDPDINSSIINFLSVQDYLNWSHLEKLGKFLVGKGSLFTEGQIEEILKVANKKNEYGISTYPLLIKSCAAALNKFFPEKRINDDSFIHKATADAMGPNNRLRYQDLIAIYKVCDLRSQNQIKLLLENYLENNFNIECYQQCVHENIFSIDYKNYFEKYVRGVNLSKGKGLKAINDHVPDFEDFFFYNFIILINKFNVSKDDQRLNHLTGLSPFERWLLNPENFDYSEFEPDWVIAANNHYVLQKIEPIEGVWAKVYQRLVQQPHWELSEIYFRSVSKKS